MSIKFLAFIGIIILLAPHLHYPQLLHGHAKTLFAALTVVITSFGFAGSIPTFCSYLNYDIRAIRIAVIGGSFITLICYLIWNLSVQGVISATKLANLATGNTTQRLVYILSGIASSHLINTFVHLFTSVCMFTSFIGVALGLSDFLADGMRVKKKENKLLVYGVTFIPPLCITLFYPNIFIMALSYAGIFCLVLLMLLPTLMAWYGRYRKKQLSSTMFVFGGKVLLGIEMLIAILLITIAIIQKIP